MLMITHQSWPKTSSPVLWRHRIKQRRLPQHMTRPLQFDGTSCEFRCPIVIYHRATASRLKAARMDSSYNTNADLSAATATAESSRSARYHLPLGLAEPCSSTVELHAIECTGHH